ncbi:uncharacterized protein LOC132193565 isoform X2 [Neocloeon triangulifer]|uniref:uncharacterized protein LOC132193565 isoform X2 n=1 Tax=Neocloeon triangulifer TaxID=2078957 RepID=UPI00286F937A|nr:uncharacterized protein LOC132193565 isoform X2 [Neocloeon triangulifer]
MAGPRDSQVPCWGLCHVLWGLCYVAAGAVQLVAGLFALYWLPVLGLGSNIITGTWNLLAGISCALIAGLATNLNATRLEILLYLSISVLTVNAVNLAVLELFEWVFLFSAEDRQNITDKSLDRLVCYARLSTSLSSALIVITALLDTHISFCVLHNIRARRRRAETNKPAPDPILNDMEYILPRRPTDLDDDEDDEQHRLTTNQNSAQAWVFDTGPVGGCITEVTPCLRAEEPPSAYNRPNTYLLSRTPQQVVVKLEVPAYEDRTSLNFMRSFSRTPSPTCSLNHPIYESVDKRTATVSPRARLYTADYAYAVQRPGSSTDTARTHRRSESCDTRPHSVSSFHPPTVVSSAVATPSGKYQYASLMIELEQAIQNKKDGDEEDGSPAGSGSTDPSTLRDNSDTEFSKELEAALQMLQDLGSPNTIETPSEPSRSITTDSTTVPQPVPAIMVLPVNGEHSSRASSSGYSSPTLTGSMSHLYPPPPPLPGACSSNIRQEATRTVISVFGPETNIGKQGVTRVHLNPSPPPPPAASSGWHFKIGTWGSRESSRSSSGIGHDYENMLLQTESLACLSELELLARHCRKKAEQREIEHRVRRKLSSSNSVRKALKNTLNTYSNQQTSHL